jgi:hypothetical protein
MTIEQTVEIPPDHRLAIEVPEEVPGGRAALASTPASLPKTENSEGKIHAGRLTHLLSYPKGTRETSRRPFLRLPPKPKK